MSTVEALSLTSEAPVITPMARIYYRLVKSGSRKIETVPIQVRAQTQWLLDEDERIAAEKLAAEEAARKAAEAEAERLAAEKLAAEEAARQAAEEAARAEAEQTPTEPEADVPASDATPE